MNVYQNLEDSLYAFVNTLFPTWTIIFAFQNGPEPQTPYLVINVKRLDIVGTEQNSGAVSVDMLGVGTTTTTQAHQATVCFEFVGKYDNNTTLAEMCTQLEVSLRSPLGYEEQHRNNLALYTIRPIERLALKRETDTYMSYQLDVVFGFAIQQIVEQDWIEALYIDGVYHDAGREPDHIITSHIEVLSQE